MIRNFSLNRFNNSLNFGIAAAPPMDGGFGNNFSEQLENPVVVIMPDTVPNNISQTVVNETTGNMSVVTEGALLNDGLAEVVTGSVVQPAMQPVNKQGRISQFRTTVEAKLVEHAGAILKAEEIFIDGGPASPTITGQAINTAARVFHKLI